MYCGHAEHSGIYIGNNEIVHLNSDGFVEVVSPKGFMANTTAVNIYVSCDGRYATGSKEVAENAKLLLGEYRSYNFILENCHQLSASCLSGDFSDNGCSFMWLLKSEAREHIGANTWRHWDDEFY
jgi:uncharacterized protein YycO